MNQQLGMDGIEAQLRAVAEARDMAPALREQAQRYLSRMVSPVRVTILGRPSPGKTSFLSAAIGEPLLPALDHPPTTELRYGEYSSMQVTRADGTVAEPTGALDAEAFDSAIFAVIERPTSLLRRISFLDIHADESPADQKAAIAWAAPRTDIAIWCARDYDDTDRALWAGVPEQIKDHAYLVLTDCDPAAADRIRDEVVEDFHEVYVLDFKRAEDETGISALTDRLLDHARLGRQADADGALLFLRSLDLTRPADRRAASRPVAVVSAPAPAAPASTPSHAPEATVAARSPEPQDAPDAPGTTHETAAAPAAKRPSMRPITRPSPAADAEGFELFSAGLDYIRRRGAALLGTVRSGDEVADHVIAAHCGETLVHLSNMLSTHEDAGSPAVADLTDTVMEAENLVILMENERGAQPALDAVAILTQVRHDFETLLAA